MADIIGGSGGTIL